MEKIISLFQRNYDGDRLVRNEVTPGAEWVLNGEGVATRKYDGTCCAIINRDFFKRYDAKVGKQPKDFIPAQEPDLITGHWPGWVHVLDDGNPADKYHREGFINWCKEFPSGMVDGTYELIGPKINGNKENYPYHTLIAHGITKLPDAPRDYESLKEWFKDKDIEGIVWHHPDGRMVKIKKKDFGYKR